uniref:TERF1 (TRF1)-interacting nuclear factor 2 n=1 Tax=Salmo trutta TaxID=8032 RepID=A0A674AIB7_SALTR
MDISLPLSSLRLLAPPLLLVSAAMWKVIKERDVMHYGTLEEFVTSTCETVPGLLTSRHQAKLALGLRARLILEVCQGLDPPDPAVILPQLDRIRALTPSSALVSDSQILTPLSQQFSVPRLWYFNGPLSPFLTNFSQLFCEKYSVCCKLCFCMPMLQKKDVKIETAVTNLHGLVEALLRDPTERALFYMVEFPSEYGPQFDQELEKLLWEFLLRLNQLLPVPSLAQTVSWLTAAPPVLEECAKAASQPQLLRTLLQHQICLGHLDLAASLPPCMGDSILSSLSLPPSGRSQQSEQSGSKPAFVSTPNPQSLTPLTNHRQTQNRSSPITPVIGGICNEDLPVMASANNRARTCKEDVTIQSDSREVEKKAESTARSKYTEVESEEDEEVIVVRRGIKRRRSARDGQSKRLLRRGRGGKLFSYVESDEKDLTSDTDEETERDLLRDCLVQLEIAGLKVPEDQHLCSYITSCLVNQPRVLIPRLTSTDITAHVRSQPPSPSCSNETPTAGRSPWRQNKRLTITVRRLPSTRQRKLNDSSLTLDVALPASADKENCVLPSVSSPSIVPLPQMRRSTEILTSPVTGDNDDVIGDSEDEVTKNFKGRLFMKRYYRTKHDTYVPTLREFWKPSLARPAVSRQRTQMTHSIIHRPMAKSFHHPWGAKYEF